MIKQIFTPLLVLFIILNFRFQVNAQSMKNDEYNITIENNLNLIEAKNIKINKEELKAGIYQEKDYILQIGYHSSKNTNPFTFEIDNNLIQYGPLIPGEPILRSNLLTINSDNYSYSILAQQNHQLSDQEKNLLIPDTTCDNGICSEKEAFEWSNPLTYGFGFRCEAKSKSGCETDFEKPQSFRQFANYEKGELPIPIINQDQLNTTQTHRIIYKTNVSLLQEKGIYQNTIKYIAIPNF